MKITKQVKLEKEFIKLGFKREWFQDKSGYWFVKKISHLDLKLKIYIQFHPNLLFLQVKSGNYYENKLDSLYFREAKMFKLSLRNVKNLVKKYGK